MNSEKVAKLIGRLLAMPFVFLFILLAALRDMIIWFWERIILFKDDELSDDENSLPKMYNPLPPPTPEQYRNSKHYAEFKRRST